MEQSPKEVKHETMTRKIMMILQHKGDLVRKRTRNYKRVYQAGGAGASCGPTVCIS